MKNSHSFSKFMFDNFGGKKSLALSVLDSFLYLIGPLRKYKTTDNSFLRVVFVCQGNICRSAFAEAIVKTKTDLEVCSVGLDTTTGSRPNHRMAIAAEKLGFNLESHSATSIYDIEILKTDLLVCMEKEHIDILNNFGYSNSKLLLGLFSSPFRARLPDPYSANDQYMKKCSEIILRSCLQLIHELENN